ncbi:hypothetical protein CR513_09388, partial [Mucuna pruriens]
MSIGSANLFESVEISNIINCFYTVEATIDSDSWSHIQSFSNFEDYISDVIDSKCKINEVPEYPKCSQFPVVDTSKPRVTRVATMVIDEGEEKLLNVLRKHKKAIGWMISHILYTSQELKMVNLPRINPSNCVHKILLEEEAQLIRQQQQRLSPTILDIVKKEVTKLLAVEIIYLISDSQRVSLVQVVPKKSGMTVVKNR